MSHIFGFEEAAAVAAFSAITVWATFQLPNKKFWKQYKHTSMIGLGCLRMVGLLDAALLVVSAYYIFRNVIADSPSFIASAVMFFFHLFAVKMRNTLYWKVKRPDLGFYAGILAFLSAAGLLVASVVHNTHGLYLVYTVLLSVYIILSFSVTTYLGYFTSNWSTILNPEGSNQWVLKGVFDPTKVEGFRKRFDSRK